MYDINYTKMRNNTLNARLETDKKYMILRMGSYLTATAGLGWYILYALNGIRFAIENGYVPVVDWKNGKLPQYDASKVGKENVWEYFFEQPCNVDLETAYESEDFFVLDDVREITFKQPLRFEHMVDFEDTRTEEWRNFFQRYIRLKKELVEYFDERIAKQGLETGNVIGVLARGTDYREMQPVGHPNAVPPEDFFPEIDPLIDNGGADKIFLATEDQTILEKFEKRYPKRVYSTDAKRYGNVGCNTLNAVYSGGKGYERDLQYLYSLYVIAKASAGIYSACGGGALASLMREGIGDKYKLLFYGRNRAKGIVVGSFLEKEQGKMILVGNKPILFYALNTLKLLRTEEVDVIISPKLRAEYENIIGRGENFGIRINYVISDTYDVVEYMSHNTDFMPTSRLVLLYADYISHGTGVVNDLRKKVAFFDGAYIWGKKNKQGVYSLTGKYVFDHDLREIVKLVAEEKEKATLEDILDEYIRRRKLLFLDYTRGTIFSKIEDEETLKKTDQMICLIEEIQQQKIGDFESFRIND